MEDYGATSMELNLNDPDIDDLHEELIDSGLSWNEISKTKHIHQSRSFIKLKYINDMEKFFKMTPSLEMSRTNSLKISVYYNIIHIPVVIGIFYAKNFRLFSKLFVSLFIF